MGLSLELAQISKAYNGQVILRDCSWVFETGLSHVLMGPNGTGKSTLLRICALLEAPDRGRVNYLADGRPLPLDLDLKRRITLLLPGVGVFNTSVFNNVAYGLKIRGINRKEIQAKVDATLEAVGLVEKKRQRALDLSTGQSKRLGLARAMVLEPEVIFLDEPTASIDQANTEIIEDIIMNLKAEKKATIIMVTHDPAQAERLGDRLLLIKDGKLWPG
ncbi:MAG: ATP-binding cassette domain-containing protein [Deltaproteobacteria bacterium]|nr:ATP-binding cassette domain-containing protein [Deltaproteobacteria bacterium]MBI4795465.1 ATP-binding cassette domain-containing protein [Deltaproteobacteria bacterium]